MSTDSLALRATIRTSLRQGRNWSVDTLIIEGWYGANFVVMCGTVGCRYDKPRCRQGTQAWCAVIVCHLCACVCSYVCGFYHDGAIKWKHFPLYWPFVRGIHWSPVNSPHKGQWRGALMFSLTCAWTNGSANNRLSKQSRRRWLETPSRSLWRHYNDFLKKQNVKIDINQSHKTRQTGYMYMICVPIAGQRWKSYGSDAWKRRESQTFAAAYHPETGPDGLDRHHQDTTGNIPRKL